MKTTFLDYFKRYIIILLLVPVSWVFAGDEEQEPQVYELSQITVTATRIERGRAEVPASVEIADEDKISATKMFNIKEALVGMPGVLVESKNQGYDSRIIIRGAGLKAKYGVRDIMVLFDGVPITDPDSLTRLDFIDTQLIKQVEVVKGPNSTLWGANAAGGVINIIPKSPFDRKETMVKAGAGDYDTRNFHLSFSNNIKESLFYTLSGSRRQTSNSWRRWNKFDINQVSFQTAAGSESGTNWKNFFGYTDASIQLPGKLDQTMFDEYKNTGRAKETEGPWQFSGRYSEIFFFNSRYSSKIGEFTFLPMIYGNIWSHHHPVTGRINDADTVTYGTDIQLNHYHTIFDVDGTLSFGITGRYDDQETDYFKYRDLSTGPGNRIVQVLSDKKGDKIETQERNVFLYGIYAQESFRPSRRWIIDAGIRFDETVFDITGKRTETYDYARAQYVPATDMEDIDKTFNAFSPRLGILYKFNESLNFYGNFSQGFQTPTEGELTENPDLDLVTVKNYEFGFKTHHLQWSMDAAVYYSPVKDEVIQVIQEEGYSEYVNSGKTDKKGFELSGSVFLTPDFQAGLTYSFTDYTFDDFSEPVRNGNTTVNIDRSGNTLPFIPENQYSIFAAYKHPCGFKLKLQSHSWGSYYIDNANTEKYKGYDFITNAMIGFEKGSLDVSVNMENLFDRQYAVEVQKDTKGTLRYNPASPRNFIVRVTYRF